MCVTAVAAVALVAFLFRGGLPEVRAAVADAGLWGPVLFVLLQMVLTVAPVPRTVFTVAAGVLFGAPTGILLAVVGTTLAAVLALHLVGYVGGPFVARYADRAPVAWVQERITNRGFLAMLSLRLVPAVPFAVLNYAAALAGVRALPFTLGTMLGVLPGTIGIVVLGDAAVGGNPHPAMLAISVVSGIVGITGAYLVARRPGPAKELSGAEGRRAGGDAA